MECDIRPVGNWHSKTVQHTLFLANSGFEMYDRGGGRQETASASAAPPADERGGTKEPPLLCQAVYDSNSGVA